MSTDGISAARSDCSFPDKGTSLPLAKQGNLAGPRPSFPLGFSPFCFRATDPVVTNFQLELSLPQQPQRVLSVSASRRLLGAILRFERKKSTRGRKSEEPSPGDERGIRESISERSPGCPWRENVTMREGLRLGLLLATRDMRKSVHPHTQKIISPAKALASKPPHFKPHISDSALVTSLHLQLRSTPVRLRSPLAAPAQPPFPPALVVSPSLPSKKLLEPHRHRLLLLDIHTDSCTDTLNPPPLPPPRHHLQTHLLHLCVRRHHQAVPPRNKPNKPSGPADLAGPVAPR